MSNDKWAFFKWPAKIRVCGREISPNISFSKAGILHRCPGLFKLQYEDKISVPSSKPVIQGSYFDALCSGAEPEGPLPESDDILIIQSRYEDYKPYIVPGEAQKPFQIGLGIGNWIVIGFLDKYPDAIPDAPIIDVKFAQKPWSSQKVNPDAPQGKETRRQAAIYCKGLGHDWVQFHVSNFREPGVQIFDCWVSQQDLDNARDYLIEGVNIILSEKREFTPNVLCDWCDYGKAGHCPAFKDIERSITNDDTTDLD